MMFESAQQMVEFSRESMRSISLDPQVGSRGGMVRRIAVRSGLSRSTIEKFWHGRLTNLTVASLDKLLSGIKKVKLDLAG